jgi:hypothetical protein
MSDRTLPLSALPGLFAAPAADVGGWFRRALRAVITRRHLAEMDDRMLADIGISRADALRESGRAPWDHGPLPR